MKRIVLSGFGQFGDYLANSTELVSHYLMRASIPGHEIVPIIFDCFLPYDGENRGEILLKTALERQANAIISLGMSSEKIGLCIERVALNQIDCPKYCREQSGRSIDSALPYGHGLPLDLAHWDIDRFYERARRNKVPLTPLSSTPGGFCCNHLIWQVKKFQLDDPVYRGIPFIFLHIPCSAECISDMKMFMLYQKVTMTVKEISQGLKILIDSLKDHAL